MVPNDALTAKVSELLTSPSETRERIYEGMYLDKNPNELFTKIDLAFHHALATEEIEKRLLSEVKKKSIRCKNWGELIEAGERNNIITAQEAKDLMVAINLRYQIIMVDDFAFDEFARAKKADKPVTDKRAKPADSLPM